MKSIKVIFIAVELAAIFSVLYLAFTQVSEDAEFFKGVYTSLCTLLAVVMQKEQQNINWYEDEDLQNI